MAKVIWKGEDTETVPGPSFTTCYGLKFPKGEAVELTDDDMLRRARGNLNFRVEEESHGESQTQDQSESKDKAKDQSEKTGYSPVKKKVRKKKPEPRADDPAAA